jgi:hypothetical protein
MTAGSAFGITICLGVVIMVILAWVTDHGIPISWQESIEKFRRSFSKSRANYSITIKVDSTRKDGYSIHVYRWDVWITRKDGERVYEGTEYGRAKTAELAFYNATKAAGKMIELDLKRRKPIIEKTFTL